MAAGSTVADGLDARAGLDGAPAGELYRALLARGCSRRSFLRFAAVTTGVLALPLTCAPRIVAALETGPRLRVVWLRGQACGGETTAFLRAANPSTAQLLLDTLVLDYHEDLMGSSGAAATDVLAELRRPGRPGYLLVVEGSVPTGADGAFCLVAGRPFAEVVREVASDAIATIAVGACAVDGGAPGAAGGVTDARSVEAVVTDRTRARMVNLPGCPANVENLSATIVHYLATGDLPALDARRRPLFAYGNLIHNQCERRAHFEFGEFSTSWGDEAAQKGWCLYKVGCKGPETFGNCPTRRYAEGASWPVKAGHGCIGCHAPNFWDASGDAYRRLPSPTLGLAPTIGVDTVGAALVGGVGALTVVHAAGMTAVRTRRAAEDRRALRRLREPEVEPAAGPAGEPGPEDVR